MCPSIHLVFLDFAPQHATFGTRAQDSQQTSASRRPATGTTPMLSNERHQAKHLGAILMVDCLPSMNGVSIGWHVRPRIEMPWRGNSVMQRSRSARFALSRSRTSIVAQIGVPTTAATMQGSPWQRRWQRWNAGRCIVIGNRCRNVPSHLTSRGAARPFGCRIIGQTVIRQALRTQVFVEWATSRPALATTAGVRMVAVPLESTSRLVAEIAISPFELSSPSTIRRAPLRA
jgi:hypothetical protein